MFENKKFNDIHATRYIASWLRGGGKLRYGKDLDDFCNWLSSLGLTEEEVDHICELAACGKLELEDSVRKFLAEVH